MRLREQAREAIERYDLPDAAEIVRQLRGTHAAFQVRAGTELYALRQFNPYADPEDLRTQFLLTELMQSAGLSTPVPARGATGEAFVVVQGRLWALFPWCDGREGRPDHAADLAVLAASQGAWVECCERLRSHPQWEPIAARAHRFRRRKPWAWVVPLDQVTRFAEESMLIEKARAEAQKGPHREELLALLPEVEQHVSDFGDLLTRRGVSDLPHTVTHGDFWATNIRIRGRVAAVLDFDCYSFEPRVTDFARAANWYHKERSPSENADLLRQFQARARLRDDELEALPLMMCAHDLYYAVSHLLLLLEEHDPCAQGRLIEHIRHEAEAPQRYRRERASLLRMFVGGE